MKTDICELIVRDIKSLKIKEVSLTRTRRNINMLSDSLKNDGFIMNHFANVACAAWSYISFDMIVSVSVELIHECLNKELLGILNPLQTCLVKAIRKPRHTIYVDAEIAEDTHSVIDGVYFMDNSIVGVSKYKHLLEIPAVDLSQIHLGTSVLIATK